MRRSRCMPNGCSACFLMRRATDPVSVKVPWHSHLLRSEPRNSLWAAPTNLFVGGVSKGDRQAEAHGQAGLSVPPRTGVPARLSATQDRSEAPEGSNPAAGKSSQTPDPDTRSWDFRPSRSSSILEALPTGTANGGCQHGPARDSANFDDPARSVCKHSGFSGTSPGRAIRQSLADGNA